MMCWARDSNENALLTSRPTSRKIGGPLRFISLMETKVLATEPRKLEIGQVIHSRPQLFHSVAAAEIFAQRGVWRIRFAVNVFPAASNHRVISGSDENR
jgi:hypothetical protein